MTMGVWSSVPWGHSGSQYKIASKLSCPRDEDSEAFVQ